MMHFDGGERRATGECALQSDQLCALLQHAPAAVCVLVGPDHVVDMANTSFERIFPGRRLVGRPLREALPELAVEGFVAPLDQVRASGRAYAGRSQPLRAPRRAEGHADAWYSFTYQPLLDARAEAQDARGQAQGVLVFGFDVTEQVEAMREAQTARSHAALLAKVGETLASSLDYETTIARVVALTMPALADFGFFDVDEGEGRVRRVPLAYQDPRRQAILEKTQWVRSEREDLNLCALSSGDPGFHPWIDDDWMQRIAVGPEHLALLRELDFRSMITVPLIYQGRLRGALTLFYADSGRHHSEADLVLAVELARRAAAAVENARLYESLKASEARAKEAYRAAREADRRKDEFLALLGHELRNPLAPILTALELMRLKSPEVAPRERAVIERQVHHMVQLVDDLLDISRITRGKIELRTEPIELAEVIARAAEMAGPLIEQRRHRLSIEAPPEGLCVAADPMRLAQVFANLLTNAAKYTDPGGSIAVEASCDGAVARVRVRDTGHGIAPEMLEAVFEPFVQVERASETLGGGLGLGLPLVRSLIALHQGSVRAFSEGRGRGSEFVVELPILGEEERAISEREVARGSDPALPQHRRRVLIVDDNVDAALLLADALRAIGHEVAVAHDGPSALKLAPGFRPEVAVLDIGLPVMDGHELGRQLLAQLEEAPRLVAVTGYGELRDRRETQRSGFTAHLVKPVDLEKLARVIAKLEG